MDGTSIAQESAPRTQDPDVSPALLNAGWECYPGVARPKVPKPIEANFASRWLQDRQYLPQSQCPLRTATIIALPLGRDFE